MKKYVTLLMLFMAVPMMMMAQNPNGKEKFDPEVHKQKQHEFMKEKAELNDEEATTFYAIYDEMRMKEREIYGDSREMRRKRPETDEECRAAMLHADSLELAIKQLQYNYHQRLLNAIPPKKAVRAIMAGEEFDRLAFRDMMREWRRDNQDGDKRHDGPRPGMRKGHHNGLGHDGPAPDGPAPEGPAPDSDKSVE